MLTRPQTDGRARRIQCCSIRVHSLPGDRFGIEPAQRKFTPARTHPQAQILVVEQSQQSLGQRGLILGLHHEPAFAVIHHLRHATDPRSNDGFPAAMA